MENNRIDQLWELCDTAAEIGFFVQQDAIEAASRERAELVTLMNKPDEKAKDEKAKKEREAKIESRVGYLSAFPREKEVLKKIFAHDKQLRVEDLVMIRKDYGMSGLPVFLEFQHRTPNANIFDGSDTTSYVATYVYYDERCKNPDHLFGSIKRWDIKNAPKATVLLRISHAGKMTEIHRWNDEQET